MDKPAIHNRKSIRLQRYDYSQAGAYFVTICTQGHKCLFGEITGDKMLLNVMGQIAAEQWNAIPQRFTNVELDAFVVMPNHIHGILVITAGAPADAQQATDAITLGGIVGVYKSLCVHNSLKWIKQNRPGRTLGSLWQRNYWEHVVRNERELNHIREYIDNNPKQWQWDSLNAGWGGSSTTPSKIRETIIEYGIKVWMV